MTSTTYYNCPQLIVNISRACMRIGISYVHCNTPRSLELCTHHTCHKRNTNIFWFFFSPLLCEQTANNTAALSTPRTRCCVSKMCCILRIFCMCVHLKMCNGPLRILVDWPSSGGVGVWSDDNTTFMVLSICSCT